MPALWNNEELQLQLSDGLAQVLRANPRMYVMFFAHCLFVTSPHAFHAASRAAAAGLCRQRQQPGQYVTSFAHCLFVTSCAGSSCFMCWQLIDALIHHPRIEEAARLQVVPPERFLLPFFGFALFFSTLSRAHRLVLACVSTRRPLTAFSLQLRDALCSLSVPRASVHLPPRTFRPPSPPSSLPFCLCVRDQHAPPPPPSPPSPQLLPLSKALQVPAPTIQLQLCFFSPATSLSVV